MSSLQRVLRDSQIWKQTKAEIEGEKQFKTVIKPLIKKSKEKKKTGG